MKIRAALLLTFLALPLAPAAFATTSAQATFDEGNQLYEKGQFDDALQRYASLASQGFGGVALDYNLGNVHFRRGERGLAVLWYERALRLAPRDADIRFNLSLARSHIKSEGENFGERLLTFFSVNELAAAATVSSFLFFGALGLLALGKLRGDVLPTLSVTVTGLALVISGAWTGAAVYLDRQPVAIVVSPPGEVRNGPGADYAVGFTVPDGSKVVVLNRRPEWTQVGVPEQGLKGWMPSAELELVQPR